MATISACAVGSFVEVTWLVPSAMIFPPFAMTAAKGPPFPDRTFWSESSMALAMKRFDMMVAQLTVRAARFGRQQSLAGRSAGLKDVQILYGCSEMSLYLLYFELPLSAIEFSISLWRSSPPSVERDPPTMKSHPLPLESTLSSPNAQADFHSPGAALHTPMSSFQSLGLRRMNSSMSRMHSLFCRTSTETPRERRSSSSPMKVWFSPTMTRGI